MVQGSSHSLSATIYLRNTRLPVSPAELTPKERLNPDFSLVDVASAAFLVLKIASWENLIEDTFSMFYHYSNSDLLILLTSLIDT